MSVQTYWGVMLFGYCLDDLVLKKDVLATDVGLDKYPNLTLENLDNDGTLFEAINSKDSNLTIGMYTNGDSDFIGIGATYPWTDYGKQLARFKEKKEAEQFVYDEVSKFFIIPEKNKWPRYIDDAGIG